MGPRCDARQEVNEAEMTEELTLTLDYLILKAQIRALIDNLRDAEREIAALKKGRVIRVRHAYYHIGQGALLQ